MEWQSPEAVSRTQGIADVLTLMPEGWRSQTGRAAGASTYNCGALESNAFSGRGDEDEDDC